MGRLLLILSLSVLLPFTAVAQASSDGLARSPHLPMFLTLLDGCEKGFLRFEPSRGCGDGDCAAVQEALTHRFGSPSLNRSDLKMWNRGKVLVSLIRGDQLHKDALMVSIMVPESSTSRVSSAGANGAAARVRRPLIPKVKFKLDNHATTR